MDDKELIKVIEKEKIIAIVRNVGKNKIVPLVSALVKGGVKFIETTFTQGGDDNETYEKIKLLVDKFKGQVHIGSGTVLTVQQAELTKAAGGEFAISPDTNEEIIKKAKEFGLVSIAGALTPTEIAAADRAGADFVKVFPAGNLGTAYIKAIKAPLSKVKLLAVGGINTDNIKEFLQAGICGFGIGTNIIDKKMLAENNYDGITELAKKYIESVKI